MAIWNTLRSQLDAPRFTAHRIAFDKLQSLPEGLGKAKAAAQSKGTLNENGIIEAVREYASKHVAANLRHEMKRLDAGRKSLADRRRALTIPNSDPTNVADALLKQEIRKYVLSLDPAKRTALLTVDPDPTVLAAVFEGPSFLTEVDAGLRAQAESAFVESKFPTESAVLREDTEALQVLEMALDASRKELREAMGLSEPEFNKWLATSAPLSDGEGV
ncbi:hypothetical protein [Nitrobacter sp.]|uniref:hypothetical protein n=1 Tax=Nitrobacter sp. TaxID=29420 RepID=UPI003F6537A0